MDGFDLAFYLIGGLVAAIIVYLGGHVSSTKPWHRKAFMSLGVLSFLIYAGAGIKNYYSTKKLNAKATTAENEAKAARQEQQEDFDKNREALEDISASLDKILDASTTSPKQRQEVRKLKQTIDYSPATLRAMSDVSLILTAQTMASKLRELDKEMDAAYNAINKEWERKNREAKSKEQRDIIGSERMDKNQRMMESYDQRFRDDFLRDTQSLQTELVRRASTIKIRGPVIVPLKPGTNRIDAPSLPSAPRALQQGDIMTFGELSQVADYLVELCNHL